MRHSIISQFRIGILALHLETGRFKNVKEDERIFGRCFLSKDWFVFIKYVYKPHNFSLFI